ncbi:MAG: hypothetical protein SVT56_04890 [Chloroflexota bacterium]|nr:hypothetical protein [Chloroflexota bacterium]
MPKSKRRYKNKKSDRKIIVIASDLHAGHILGLMNPETKLTQQIVDKKTGKSKQIFKEHELSEFQAYLWNTIWTPGIKEVKELAEGFPVALIVNGDITQGQKHPEQLVTTSTANQFLIASGVVEPWIESIPSLEMVRFSYGTASHIFNEGTSPIIVSQLLTPKYPKVDIGVVHHGYLEVAGQTIDYAHHGPSQGIREWTKGNQLRYYLKSIMSGAYKNGVRPPDIVIRSHYHYPHREIVSDFIQGENGQPETIESRIYLTPSMCGLNDYGQQATKSTPMIYNGFFVFEIEDGRIVNDHLDDFVWALDLRTKEVWE